MKQAVAWKIEEVCFNAFPSLKQVLYGNWLLRFADGMTRRANSVNALRAECSGDDPAALIAAAEPLYRAQRLPAIFRTLSILDPALDQALTTCGYGTEGESCVLYGAIGALAAEADPAVRLVPRPEPDWLAAMAALQGHSPAQSAIYRRIVAAIAVSARFALLAVDGLPAALAYGALHDGLLCYESVVTDPQHRRQGLGRRVIAGLAHWASEAGAAGACLEVEAGNAPALALYAQFGLAELYRYHYRRQPPQH
jgi:GNAT superfamily N-acetyltransferase